MNEQRYQMHDVRIANFSNVEIPGDHLLEFDGDEPDRIVQKI